MRKNNCIHLWFPNLFNLKGGIQVYLQDLLQGLNEELTNSKITVFNKLDATKPNDKFDSENLEFRFSGNVPNLLQLPHFVGNLITRAFIDKPKLIVCGHLNFAPIAFLIHRLTGIPYWICVYGADAWDIQDKWKKQALHSAEKIISISGYTSDRLIREQVLNPQKISLLPVTFDASRFKIAPKPTHLLERYGLSPEQPIILTVGRLASAERHKGYDQVIQSLPTIIQELPNIHYLIVGKGDDRTRVEQLIQSLNLQRYVTLAGFIPDAELADHYNLCDIFAMPSKAEGFGIVYLEALACGKPTLGGDRDGAIDALCHGEVGVLVNPNDVNAIAKSIIQVLQGTHPNLAIYQAEKLRQKVIETYGVERFKKTLAHHIAKVKNSSPTTASKILFS